MGSVELLTGANERLDATNDTRDDCKELVAN